MPRAPLAWLVNVLLFIATVGSVFVTWLWEETPRFTHESFVHAGQYTATLLSILLAHEFGHYFAAKAHGVDASLPFFIPMPHLSPFGTMGAVIRMRTRIKTCRALLDIGAAGPLAGLALAIPLYLWGIHHVTFMPESELDGSVLLGESLLTRGLDWLAAPKPPLGMEPAPSPIAFAAWGGFLVTMMNLVPVSQLDGGHIAYALFGPKQNRYAVLVHRALLVFAGVSIAAYTMRDFRIGIGLAHASRNIQNSMFWLVWFELLAVLGTYATRSNLVARSDKAPKPVPTPVRIVGVLGLSVIASLIRPSHAAADVFVFFAALVTLLAMEAHGGVLRRHDLLDHPPSGDDTLGPVRRAIAIGTLAMFAALFMVSPFII